jgi:hypothetical protein
MVSYGDFHQIPACHNAAVKYGLRKFLSAPAHVQIFLDNGAFYFARKKGEAGQRKYREFILRAKPDWYPVRFDAIPMPQMSARKQWTCYERTMRFNRAYQHDGYVPVIHVSTLLDEYVAALKKNRNLCRKNKLALGGWFLIFFEARRPWATIKFWRACNKSDASFRKRIYTCSELAGLRRFTWRSCWISIQSTRADGGTAQHAESFSFPEPAIGAP